MKKTNFLNHHLSETKENYLEHFLFTFSLALWLLVAGATLLIHSFLPFLFVHHTSKHIKKINDVMQKRSNKLSSERV
jgi:hypothetical protein